MATTRIMPLHTAKAVQKARQSATSLTMQQIRKRQTTADSSQDMSVTAGLLTQSFCWQSASTLLPPDGREEQMM